VAAVVFVPWNRLPPYAAAIPPIAYFLVVALLVQTAGGGPSGYVPLVLLPIFWLALYGTRSELAIAMVAAFSMFVAPLVFLQNRAYSHAELREALLWMAISLVVGVTAQGLVRKVREHAAETQRRGEELLEAQREADRLKDEFFALVSHELRTPLSSITGYLELLMEDAEGKLDAEAWNHLEVIQRNADRLLRLVADILLVAQVQAGTFSLAKEPTDVSTLVAEAVEAAMPTAATKGIALNMDSDPLPPIDGDRDRLAQLLDNLISKRAQVHAFRGEDRCAELPLGRSDRARGGEHRNLHPPRRAGEALRPLLPGVGRRSSRRSAASVSAWRYARRSPRRTEARSRSAARKAAAPASSCGFPRPSVSRRTSPISSTREAMA